MKKFLGTIIAVIMLAAPVFPEGQKLQKVPKEGSHTFITGTFYDKDGNKVQPYNLEYWVNDVRTGELLIPKRTPVRVKTASPTPTAIGASPTPTFGYLSTVVFDLPVCATRMITSNQSIETKRISVKFEYAGNKVGTDEAEWNVEQMPGLNVIQPSAAAWATPSTDCTSVVANTPTPTATPD